jgi:hypothetical protein
MSTETQTTVNENVEDQANPVFDEINTIDENGAINVLIQAAQLAQGTGRLSVRDSVLLAKAIDTVRPGTI